MTNISLIILLINLFASQTASVSHFPPQLLLFACAWLIIVDIMSEAVSWARSRPLTYGRVMLLHVNPPPGSCFSAGDVEMETASNPCSLHDNATSHWPRVSQSVIQPSRALMDDCAMESGTTLHSAFICLQAGDSVSPGRPTLPCSKQIGTNGQGVIFDEWVQTNLSVAASFLFLFCAISPHISPQGRQKRHTRTFKILKQHKLH